MEGGERQNSTMIQTQLFLSQQPVILGMLVFLSRISWWRTPKISVSSWRKTVVVQQWKANEKMLHGSENTHLHPQMPATVSFFSPSPTR